MSVYGLCDRNEVHDAHMADPPDTAFSDHHCPGQYADCRNCDDRRCMGCVFREYGHHCADDCPERCPAVTLSPPNVIPGLRDLLERPSVFDVPRLPNG